MGNQIGMSPPRVMISFFKNWRTIFGLSVVILVDILWEFLNEVPAIWDMAYHQLLGWSYLEAFRSGTLASEFAILSPIYPPLYYLQEAFVFSFFPESDFKILIVNLPFILLIAYATYRISNLFLTVSSSGWAPVLVLLFPVMSMVYREALLDGALAAWVTAGAWLIIRSRWFIRTGWTLCFGLIFALGILTKWTMPIYLIIPVIFGVVVSGKPTRAIKNLMLAFFLILPLVCFYYLPNLANMVSRYPTTEQVGLMPWLPYPRHGEPGLNNIWGWIYYPRVLSSYFLFFPLTVVFSIGVFRRKMIGPVKGFVSEKIPLFLFYWLFSGLLFLIFLSPKDPRFALPIVPPLAMLLLYLWDDRPRLIRLIVFVAFAQSLSFSLPLFRPVKLALFEVEGDKDYQSLQKEWVLYANHYFHLGGPPTKENWKLADILELIPDGSTVGVLPTLPRFHAGSFQLKSVTSGRNVHFFDFNEGSFGEDGLQIADLMVAKTGHQGISFITGENQKTMQLLRIQNWTVLGEWTLPDGEQAQLWKSY